LVRYRADGNIDFVGRRDRQVKVRGVRIELEEIEAVLLCHPAVKEVALVVRPAEGGSLRLVAYLVSEASDNELRIFLEGRLPEYMDRAAWVRVAKLPRTLTSNVESEEPGG